MCGGTHRPGQPRRAAGGLSPRVRGNPGRTWEYRRTIWSIPACAGEPSRLLFSIARGTVYPRVCGGTAPSWPGAPSMPGLSPRVRGNRPVSLQFRVVVGSIPACAGEPGTVGGGASVKRVYPRVCGGTMPLAEKSTRTGGLSPRVRGNQPYRLPVLGSRRSIPACAGEPTCGYKKARTMRVYPRVCGGTR